MQTVCISVSWIGVEGVITHPEPKSILAASRDRVKQPKSYIYSCRSCRAEMDRKIKRKRDNLFEKQRRPGRSQGIIIDNAEKQKPVLQKAER